MNLKTQPLPHRVPLFEVSSRARNETRDPVEVSAEGAMKYAHATSMGFRVAQDC